MFFIECFFFQGIADCWDLQSRMSGAIVARRQIMCLLWSMVVYGGVVCGGVVCDVVW